MKKMMKRWWVYQKTSKYDRRMTSMDEVMMRMSASVIATPVNPAMVVNMTMVGFCNDKLESVSSLGKLSEMQKYLKTKKH